MWIQPELLLKGFAKPILHLWRKKHTTEPVIDLFSLLLKMIDIGEKPIHLYNPYI
jgi:hypothetical protein